MTEGAGPPLAPGEWSATSLGVAPQLCRPPAARVGTVDRTRLIGALVAQAHRRLVVVSAPAGYGKTTAIALWAQADPRPFAWASLEGADGDPVHLVRHIAASLDAIGPLPPDLAWSLAGTGRDADELLGALDAELSRRPPFVLVLDDVHLVPPAVRRPLLGRLLASLPPGAQLALASRTDDPVPLARHRMEDDLVEVGAAELAMDEEEARLLLDHTGVDVTRHDPAELVELTEGWPGGLHLAGLALLRSGGDEPPFSGRNRLVADYLVEQVLEQLPADTTDFLERSSVLDRFRASDLDELLEIDDGARRLAAVERSGNLFLVALDDERTWYRYHHLFADLLRSRLRGRSPSEARALHARAAAMAERAGDVDAAIRHAIDADDERRACGIMLAHASAFTLAGRGPVLRRWLDLLGPDAVERNAAALVVEGWYGLAESDPDLVTRSCLAAEARDPGGPLEPLTPSTAAAVSVLRSVVSSGGLRGVSDLARVARSAGPPERNRWWALATAFDGVVLSMVGERAEARARFVEALPHLHAAPAIAAGVHAHLAYLDLAEGDLRRADAGARTAVALVERNNLGAMAVTVPAFAVGALVAAQVGDGAEARRRAAVAAGLLDRLSDAVSRTKLFCNLVLARAAVVLDDRDAAAFHVDLTIHAQRIEPDAVALNDELADLVAQLAAGRGRHSTGNEPLTSAELRVLRLLPTHLSLQQVADELFVSRNTAKTHTVAIYRKLGVSGRGEAVEAARRTGLLPR